MLPENYSDGEQEAKKESEKWGCRVGANCVQVKGRVAFGSPLARFTPSGKAVRGFLLPPKKCELSKIGWHGMKYGRKRGGFSGGLGRLDSAARPLARLRKNCSLRTGRWIRLSMTWFGQDSSQKNSAGGRTAAGTACSFSLSGNENKNRNATKGEVRPLGGIRDMSGWRMQ